MYVYIDSSIKMKRHVISFELKKKIIDAAEGGSKNKELCEKFNLQFGVKSTEIIEESDDDDEAVIEDLAVDRQITRKEAQKCLDNFGRYMQQNGADSDDLAALDKFDDKLAKMRLQQSRQAKITDFFI
jgi:hypothetical protein